MVLMNDEKPGLAQRLWEGIRQYASSWSGVRTFLVSSAALFIFLSMAGAMQFMVAVTSFLFLAGITVLRGAVTGETDAVSVQAVPARSTRPRLGSGPGLAILNQLPDPLFVLEASGRVIYCNAAAIPLIGGNAIGKHVATVLRSAPLITAIEDIIKGGAAQSIEYRVPVPIERYFNAFIAPIETDPGKTATGHDTLNGGLVLVLLHDLTDAKRVESMRVDFVANASHELKTPLASMSGFIDTLRGHAKDDPEARTRFLDIMAEQAGRMKRLIDDLLSLSRIELREHVRPDSIVDLLSVVNDVTDGLTPLAEQNNVEIDIQPSPDLPAVRGDRDELAQVVQNLVDNALRYGRSGKRIVITLAPEVKLNRPMVKLAVTDFGPGISRSHLPRLTERFYRVDAAASRAKGGTGLGLAIVKHIVNRHQGTLTMDSEIGKGSTFAILIPVSGDDLRHKADGVKALPKPK